MPYKSSLFKFLRFTRWEGHIRNNKLAEACKRCFVLHPIRSYQNNIVCFIIKYWLNVSIKVLQVK